MASTHRRFDEEDGGADDQNLSEAAAATQKPSQISYTTSVSEKRDPDGESDSDDAPEAVSTAAAVSASRDQKRRLAEMLRQTDDMKKVKRKKLDASRVRQTQSRRKTQSATASAATVDVADGVKAETGAEAENEETDPGSEVASQASGDDDSNSNAIPFLPLDIIAAAERARMAPKPVTVPKALEKARKKRKLIDANSKPPKDLRVGSTLIHVLANPSKTLPPKATGALEIAKEAWLARCGSKNNSTGARKPWKTRFVKK